MKAYAIALVAFLILDSLWLGIIMKDFNLRSLAKIGRIKDGKIDVLYLPALIVYFLMPLAIALFVTPQLGLEISHWQAFLWGAGMGLIIYGVYDFTNLAVLRDYPLGFALIDVAWGSFLFGVVTVIVRLSLPMLDT